MRDPMVRSMLGVLVIAGTLVGCASSPQGGGVQVVDRNQRDKVTSGQYIVRRGDTLWSIAFRFGWDWRELARVNGIQPPHVIYPGQKIRFDGGASRVPAAPRPAPQPASTCANQPGGSGHAGAASACHYHTRQLATCRSAGKHSGYAGCPLGKRLA